MIDKDDIGNKTLSIYSDHAGHSSFENLAVCATMIGCIFAAMQQNADKTICAEIIRSAMTNIGWIQ